MHQGKKTGIRTIAAILFAVLSSLCVATHQAAFAQEAQTDSLTLYVPGSPGGGFDRTATAIHDSLLDSGAVVKVEIVHSPGAGGLIALAQFIEAQKGNPQSVFVGGRTNIGATQFNRSNVSLSGVTPVARLNGIVLAIAVPKASEFNDLSDLVSTLRTDASLIKWAGGSAGSVDELLILELATAIGVDRTLIDYRAIPGGGDSVANHALSGQSNVAVSSLEELSEFYAADQIRILAVSSQERVAGISAPTLSEFGLDIVFSDWKAVFGAPDISSDAHQNLVNIFTQMSSSNSWSQSLEENGWQNVFLSGDAFAEFVASETQSISGLSRDLGAGELPTDRIAQIVGRQYRWLFWAFGVIGLLLVVLWVQRTKGRTREQKLEASLEDMEGELERKLEGSRNHIDGKFVEWKLTESETEIGWLLLKGLSFKEIASARGTSERTVRQQARSIYAKSSLANRSDLSAFFFEDFVFGQS